MGGYFEAEYDQHVADHETGHDFSQSTAHTAMGVPPGIATMDCYNNIMSLIIKFMAINLPDIVYQIMHKSTRNCLYRCTH